MFRSYFVNDGIAFTVHDFMTKFRFYQSTAAYSDNICVVFYRITSRFFAEDIAYNNKLCFIIESCFE